MAKKSAGWGDAARKIMSDGTLRVERGHVRNEVDDAIDAVVGAAGVKHPKHPPDAASRLESAMRRAARDMDARDRNERRAQGPLEVREKPNVVLPPGARI